MDDSFRPHTAQATPSHSVTVSDGAIHFHQTTSHAWQRTGFQIGDREPRYTTTARDATRALPPGDSVDLALARERRQQFARSSVPHGHDFPSVDQSAAQAATPHHRHSVPPPQSDRTAFTSHHDYRNWAGAPTTTSREAFQAPRTMDQVQPLNRRMHDTSASFGNEAIIENRTLYGDTFTPPPSVMERVDMQAARDFHQGNHNDHRVGPAERLEITTNQATYRGCPGGRASEMCAGPRGGHNVVPSDPHFGGGRSAMQDDYVPHRDVKVPAPIDNSLQKSHIQLQAGSGGTFSTTQSDYFQWQQYRMPGQTF
jgi:hypothetical protein